MFIEILFKIVLFKGGVLIYAEHCVYIFMCGCHWFCFAFSLKGLALHSHNNFLLILTVVWGLFYGTKFSFYFTVGN